MQALAFEVLGEDVLITGAGPIGIMAIPVVKHAGARHVVITDVNDAIESITGFTRSEMVGKTTLAFVPQAWKKIVIDYIAAGREDAYEAAILHKEGHEVPEGFDYALISGLSNELKQKLIKVQPRSLAQAGRIEGMTPAALTLILASLRRAERARVAV